MIDLDGDTGSVFMNIFAQLVQAWYVIIRIYTQLGCSVGALRRIHTGIFNDQQSGTAFCSLFIVIDVQKAHFSVLLSEIGAHRHHHNSVFYSHMTNGHGTENMLVFAFHDLLRCNLISTM